MKTFKNSKPWDDLTIGPTVKDIDKLLEEGCNDNANMFKNPETMHKYTADAVSKRYALLKLLPREAAESHINAYIHVHDLEYFYARPFNCLQHDLRWFIRNGLKVDGSGLHTSVAGPARRLSVLINQAGQILGSGQGNMSGGQSIPLLNTFMAPFVGRMNDEELEQNMQSLIYNLNQAYVSRGGQAVFSTVNMDFGIPKFLRDDPAYGPGGVEQGVYGDYEDESRRILRAFTNVMLQGDYTGKPFMFPNTVYRIEDKKYDSDDMDLVCELSSKFSIPYFTKDVAGEEYHNVMGCRTRLNSNWTGDPNSDCLRTGNLAYISLNLPRYALKGDLWNELQHAMEVAKEVLLIRKEHGLKLMEKKNLMPFLAQTNDEGERYSGVEHATLSFGIVGLSDALTILTGSGLDNKSSRKLGHTIMQYINDYAKRLVNETGDRWTVLQSPAESTAGRFAMEDKRKYGKRAPVHGTTGGYYYTNSTHVDVDSGLNFIEKIQAEQNFHKETSGGHIFHGYLGERWSSSSVRNITEKLINKSNMGFWTTTSVYSVCPSENILIPSAQFECPQCGTPTEVYDRITGYMQRVSGWNKSKQAEYKDRKRY